MIIFNLPFYLHVRFTDTDTGNVIWLKMSDRRPVSADQRFYLVKVLRDTDNAERFPIACTSTVVQSRFVDCNVNCWHAVLTCRGHRTSPRLGSLVYGPFACSDQRSYVRGLWCQSATTLAWAWSPAALVAACAEGCSASDSEVPLILLVILRTRRATNFTHNIRLEWLIIRAS